VEQLQTTRDASVVTTANAETTADVDKRNKNLDQLDANAELIAHAQIASVEQ
jgi:hypothetical protein